MLPRGRCLARKCGHGFRAGRVTGFGQSGQRVSPVQHALSGLRAVAKVALGPNAECRLCDSAALAGTRTNAVVPSPGRARLDLGDSASDWLLGAAEIRTPAFRRSARARGIVRPVAATSVPAGWGSARASRRLRKPGSSASRFLTGALLPMQPLASAGGRVAVASRPTRHCATRRHMTGRGERPRLRPP